MGVVLFISVLICSEIQRKFISFCCIFLQNICGTSFFVYLCVKFNLFHLRLFFVFFIMFAAGIFIRCFFYKIFAWNSFLFIFAHRIRFFIEIKFYLLGETQRRVYFRCVLFIKTLCRIVFCLSLYSEKVFFIYIVFRLLAKHNGELFFRCVLFFLAVW